MRSITSAVIVAAGLAAGLATVSAQTPQPQTPTQPAQPPSAQRPMTTPPAGATAATMTIVGCLRDEKDVPGLKPNAAERAGITEDYILTNVKAGASSASTGLALGNMYEIEGIAEAELKKHLGHQVEITGRVDATDGGARDRKDVPDFNATGLKMVSANCPAK